MRHKIPNICCFFETLRCALAHWAHPVCVLMVLTDGAQGCITISSEMSEKNDSIIFEKPIIMSYIVYIWNTNINIIPFHIMLPDSLHASITAIVKFRAEALVTYVCITVCVCLAQLRNATQSPTHSI